MKKSGAKTGYELIRSSRRTVGMSLDREGNIIVRAPYLCPRATIERFVAEHADWIEKQRSKLKRSAETAQFAGALSEADIKLLAKQMKAVLPEKLSRYASVLGVSFGRVTVRCQKSKWGSCSAQGNLNFNCLLMLAPEEVLDYVIIHELCHRRHMDHSKDFWADVALACPGYGDCRRWLRTEGPALMMRAERKTHA